MDANVRSPFTINFSLAVDRQLTPNFVVSAGYVGSHSGNLIAAGGDTGSTSYGNDANAYAGDLIPHINCVESSTQNACTGTQTLLNTSFGSINYAYNSAVGNYDGLVLSARGRFTQRGFHTASYTFGHSLDDWQNYPVASPPTSSMVLRPMTFETDSRSAPPTSFLVRMLVTAWSLVCLEAGPSRVSPSYNRARPSPHLRALPSPDS